MDLFLAFDPAASLHYEVFLLPEIKTQPDVKEKIQPCKQVQNIQQKTEQLSEVGQEEVHIKVHSGYMGQFHALSPTESDVRTKKLQSLEKQEEIHDHVPGDVESKDSVISVLVFSSQAGQWVNREFVPGCCAPRNLYDMVNAPNPRHVKVWKTAEYWHGSLYVHCWNNIIMILRNSEGVYDMAQLPGKAYDDSEYGGMSKLPKRSILASYEKGVHYVALDKFQLHVWKLIESNDGQVEWMLAHQADLTPYNRAMQQCIEPRVWWEAVENNKAIVSLFKPRITEAIIYAEENSQSKTTDEDDKDRDDAEDGDGDGDDDDDDDDDW
jgi:hypothetical protein